MSEKETKRIRKEWSPNYSVTHCGKELFFCTDGKKLGEVLDYLENQMTADEWENIDVKYVPRVEEIEESD